MEKGSIQLRKMSVSDHEPLLRLWNAAGLEHRPEGRDSLASISRDLSNETNLFLLAWDDDELVGSVLCTDDGRKGWINRLAVRPSHRRRGLASALVNAAEEHFQAKGIDVYSIIVYRANNDSLELFHALGYEDHDETIYLSKKTRPEA